MITLIFLLIAGFFAASMNAVRVHYRKSLYNKWFPKNRSFFDESISWKNKFKKGDRNKGDRFLLSTTFLSFTTDFYNLSKFIMVISLMTGVIFYIPIFGNSGYSLIYDIILNYFVFAISYEGFKKFLVG